MSWIQLLRIELPWLTLCALLGKYTGEILGSPAPIQWAITFTGKGAVITLIIWWVLKEKHEEKEAQRRAEAPYEGRVKYIEQEAVPTSVARANGFTQYVKSSYDKEWHPITEDTKGILVKVRKYV